MLAYQCKMVETFWLNIEKMNYDPHNYAQDSSHTINENSSQRYDESQLILKLVSFSIFKL